MEQEEKMGVGFTGQKAIGLALAGAMCLALIVVPARAQDVVWGRKSCPPCPPCLAAHREACPGCHAADSFACSTSHPTAC